MITQKSLKEYQASVSYLLRNEICLIKSKLIVVVIILSAPSCLAQTVFKGSVVNKSGEAVTGTITIQARNSPTIAEFSTCDSQGKYTITYKGKADSVTITLSSMLIGKHSRTVKNQSLL